MKTEMNYNKRLERLEIESGISIPEFDSVMYHEGDPIQYDGFTFENEADLKAYGDSINVSILPVCIVNGKKQ